MTEFVNRQQRRAAQRHLAKVAKGTKNHPYPECITRPEPRSQSKWEPHQGARECARRRRQLGT